MRRVCFKAATLVTMVTFTFVVASQGRSGLRWRRLGWISSVGFAVPIGCRMLIHRMKAIWWRHRHRVRRHERLRIGIWIIAAITVCAIWG